MALVTVEQIFSGTSAACFEVHQYLHILYSHSTPTGVNTLSCLSVTAFYGGQVLPDSYRLRSHLHLPQVLVKAALAAAKVRALRLSAVNSCLPGAA